MNQWQAQGISIIVELGVALLFLPTFFRVKQKETIFSVLVALMAGTLISHPIAWYLNQKLYWLGIPAWPRLLALELGVVLIEGIVIFYSSGLKFISSIGLACLANSISFGLGLVFFLS